MPLFCRPAGAFVLRGAIPGVAPAARAYPRLLSSRPAGAAFIPPRLLLLLIIGLLVLPIRSSGLPSEQDIEAGNRLEAVYYEQADLLGASARIPRPPEQVVNGLKAALQAAPDRAEYLKLLAEQEVLLLRFADAEQHMLAYARASGNSSASLRELAAFYASRHMPRKQIEALQDAAAASIKSAPPAAALSRRPAFQIYQEIFSVIDEQRPEGLDKVGCASKLAALFPDDSAVAKILHQQLREDRRTKELRDELSAFRARHPDEVEYALGLEADVLVLEGQTAQAIQLMDRAFQPLWSPEMIGRFYNLLKQDRRRWLQYTGDLERRLDRNPRDTDAAIRLFYCYQQDGNMETAVRVLRDFRRYKEGLESGSAMTPASRWRASELLVLGHIFLRLSDFNEAARHFYALYELLGTAGYRETGAIWPAIGARPSREEALYRIFESLILAVGRATQIGSGNLDYYKRISELDSNPGTLNAILSVLLNRTSPEWEFRQEEQKAATYFNVRKADELYRVIIAQYPQSAYRTKMSHALLRAFAGYGQHGAVVKAGLEEMGRSPASPDYLNIGLLVADSQAALGRNEECWKTYDTLLANAARQSSEALLDVPVAAPAPDAQDQNRAIQAESEYPPGESAQGRAAYGPGADRQIPTEATYAQILARYVSSLTQARATDRVLQLYRREIDAHPNEAGLYERLAQFLEQNRLFDEVDKVYQRAIQQFKDRSWYDRLARWYLRRRMNSQYAQLSQQVAEVFRGSEIAEYIQKIVASSPASNAIYLQINLFANRRFPHHLAFVHNLLNYYRQPRSLNPVEWERLCRQYYFLSPVAQKEYVIHLSRQNRLDSTLASLQGSEAATSEEWMKRRNPAEIRLLAEGLLWRSQFESAAPLLSSLAVAHPDFKELAETDAVLHRSLGALNPAHYGQSVQMRDRLAQLFPTDSQQLVAAGETLVDAGQLSRAIDYWKRIPETAPGKADSYLDAATVFWDYFQYPQAMDQIALYRRISRSPHALNYEAGAILESQGQAEAGIGEYFAALLPAGEKDYSSRNRLRQLLERPEARELVLKAGLERTRGPGGLEFLPGYLDFLNANRQRAEIVSLLETHRDSVVREPLWPTAQRVLRAQGLSDLEEKLLADRIQRAVDATDRIAVSAELADRLVANKKLDQASGIWNGLVAQYPKNVGVIEGSARHFWRQGSRQRAVAILDAAVQGANRRYARQFLEQESGYQLEMADYAAVEKTLQRLLQLEPLNANYFNRLGRLYARWDKPELLMQHYEAGLARLRDDSSLNKEEKEERTIALRLGLAEADTALSRFSEAVDQHIEILNRRPDDAAMAARAAAFAEAHGLEQKLLGFFSRQAAQSNKDYRWPRVLGRIHRRLGNAEESLAYFAKAVEIRPDQVDLLQELADMQVRMGKIDDALASHERLFRQTYRSPRWLYAAAALRAGQGRMKEALDLLQQAMTANNIPPAQRGLHLAQQLALWNRPQESFDAAGQFLGIFERNPAGLEMFVPGLNAYVHSAVRLGRTAEAWNRLLAIVRATEDDTARYLVQNVLRYALPDALRDYATAAEMSSAEAAIQISYKESERLPREQWQELVLTVSSRAGMPFLAEAVLKTSIAEAYASSRDLNDESWNRYRQLCSQLERFYRTRSAYAELARWQESEWRRNRFRINFPRDLLEIADNYEYSNLKNEKIRILKEYLELPGIDGQARAMATTRYVESLAASGREKDLEALAANPGPDAAAVANALILAGKHSLAAQAVGGSTPPRAAWITAQKFLISTAAGLPDAGAVPEMQKILRLGAIGQLLAAPPDREQQLIGEEWFYTASRYGVFLGRGKSGAIPEADRYIAADLEAHPKDTDAQVRTGDVYLNMGNTAKALEFYRQAVKLQPLSYRYRERLAAGLLASQQREEAVSEWRSILENQISPAGAPSSRRLDTRIQHARTVVDAALANNFFESIQTPLRRFLGEVVRVQGHYSVADLLELLLSRSGTESRGAMIREWIDGTPDSLGMADYLLDILNLTPQESASVFESASQKIASSMPADDFDSSRRHRGSLWRLKFHYADFLIGAGDLDRCRQLVQELQPAAESWDEEASAWYLLKARLELKAGNLKQTIALLQELDDKAPSWVDALTTLNKAAPLLKQAGQGLAAADLALRIYQAQLENGDTDRSLFLSAAEALYEKKEIEAAHRRLQQMLYCSMGPGSQMETADPLGLGGGFSIEQLHSLAGRTAEQAGDWAAAKQFRMLPPDTPVVEADNHAENRMALARLEILHGDAAGGLRSLGEFMADTSGTARVRREAAGFIGDQLTRSLSSTVRTWLASPNGISSIKDPEFTEYLNAALQGASGNLSQEVSLHAAALRQSPYNRLALGRLLDIRDRPEAAAEIPAAISRSLFLNPEDKTPRYDCFRWLADHGNPRLALSVLGLPVFDEQGTYWQGRQLASGPLGDTGWNRAEPYLDQQPDRASAFELANAISRAAESTDMLDKAEYFARWAAYLASEDAARKAAQERLQQLRQQRTGTEVRRHHSYRVEPTISWNREANP